MPLRGSYFLTHALDGIRENQIACQIAWPCWGPCSEFVPGRRRPRCDGRCSAPHGAWHYVLLLVHRHPGQDRTHGLTRWERRVNGFYLIEVSIRVALLVFDVSFMMIGVFDSEPFLPFLQVVISRKKGKVAAVARWPSPFLRGKSCHSRPNVAPFAAADLRLAGGA